eukprot:TRINITY_DN21084_c0_g1_i2.p1 TRINITY_DN21084_c0_g1~~TRINITY_DN21084_c0_g1_i2.p1  ORF type:complete len:314 (+),score=44.04 TRINITY_DN21084_c0_g1_i2:47-988(+)
MTTIKPSAVEAYERDGIAVVEKFATKEECESLMTRMGTLIKEWDPLESKHSVFDVSSEAHLNSEYFFNSSDKISFFLEPGATDAGVLKKDFDKSVAVHKVGHALHVLDPVFKAFSNSAKYNAVTSALGYKNPVLPQSMYIFKQPRIGDSAVIHQDSTFLHTIPKCTCLGLWLALEDSTMENGCLWARPGSHKRGVRKLFVRNPDYFEKGDKKAPGIMFENLDVPQDETDGLVVTTAEQGKELGFEPLPVKQGDLVLIHGEVDHFSLKNTSNASRHSYQLHLVEGPSEGVSWSKRNWLQYSDGKSFPPLAPETA